MSSPALEQRSSGRTELVEEITQLKALLRIERSISHAAGVYERLKVTAWPMVGSNVSDGGQSVAAKQMVLRPHDSARVQAGPARSTSTSCGRWRTAQC